MFVSRDIDSCIVDIVSEYVLADFVCQIDSTKQTVPFNHLLTDKPYLSWNAVDII